MSKKRRQYSAHYKFRVAMEAGQVEPGGRDPEQNA
jgi:hypothetical protein